MYKEYMSHCPSIRTTNAFYLTPLKKAKGEIWYSSVPIGHNTLSKTISKLCKSADIAGFKTNHSTRLFQSGADEQLIMDHTGHRSVDGIRAYKQVSEEQEKEVSSILNKENKDGEVKLENCIEKRKISEEDHPMTVNLTNCNNVTIHF